MSSASGTDSDEPTRVYTTLFTRPYCIVCTVLRHDTTHTGLTPQVCGVGGVPAYLVPGVPYGPGNTINYKGQLHMQLQKLC